MTLLNVISASDDITLVHETHLYSKNTTLLATFCVQHSLITGHRSPGHGPFTIPVNPASLAASDSDLCAFKTILQCGFWLEMIFRVVSHIPILFLREDASKRTTTP